MRRKFCLAAVISLFLSFSAFAQNVERDLEKEKRIWQQLEAIAPQSVETFKAATVALDNGDYEQAARLYQQVYDKAPDFDAVMRRLGGALSGVGRVQEGMALLEKAVQKKRSPENLASLAMVLGYPDNGTEAPLNNKQRALILAKEAEALVVDDDPSYTLMVAQLAYDLQNEQDFRAATTKLARKHPELMPTHFFSALLAAMDEKWVTAEEEIRKAQSLGLPDSVVEGFLASGVHTKANIWRYAYIAVFVLAAWVGGMVVLFLLGKVMSGITLRWMEKAGPNPLEGDSHKTLRKFYRWLINVAGAYYYISIPLLIFFVPAIVAALAYASYVAGRIPVNLLAVMAFGAVVTVYQLVRSLFVRLNAEEPGRALREDEAPELWVLAREVAQTVGTRPVDEIRVTPGTEVAVYERGSFKERINDRAHRVLILGAGVLNGFDQNAFRAVLAHEYGHFRHRDTAGGDAAIRVNNDLMKFAIAMIESGQAVWWNIAFQFLRVYHFIFRRISHGATRMQEVLADRVAALNYGTAAFERGLKHVIRREVEFEDVAYWEVHNAAKERRVMQNLYEMKADHELRIEEKINEAINRPTTPDDTHPSAADRFRYVSRVESKGELPESGTVWDLFKDRAALTAEMNSLIEKQAKAVSGG